MGTTRTPPAGYPGGAALITAEASGIAVDPARMLAHRPGECGPWALSCTRCLPLVRLLRQGGGRLFEGTAAGSGRAPARARATENPLIVVNAHEARP